MVKGTTTNSHIEVKTQQRLKQQIQSVHWGKKPTPPQHDNITPHTSVATSAVIASDLRL